MELSRIDLIKQRCAKRKPPAILNKPRYLKLKLISKQRRYAERRAAGQCLDCDQVAEKSDLCLVHLEMKRARGRNWHTKKRAARKLLGQCIRCASPALLNDSECVKHVEARTINNARRYRSRKPVPMLAFSMMWGQIGLASCNYERKHGKIANMVAACFEELAK